MKNETKETKLCKHCQTEIPKKAKVCPNCRKKQGGKLKWIIIALVALMIIGAAAGGGSDDGPQKVGEVDTSPETASEGTGAVDSSEAEQEAVFRKGEIAEMNDVQVTMTDFVESTGSEFNKPTDGNIFVLAEFEIANNTESELSVSSALSFDAYADDYALNYSLTALLEKDGNQLDGTIAAGKKLKGWIGWEVPEDYKEVEIHFTDNVWSNNEFVFVYEK